MEVQRNVLLWKIQLWGRYLSGGAVDNLQPEGMAVWGWEKTFLSGSFLRSRKSMRREAWARSPLTWRRREPWRPPNWPTWAARARLSAGVAGVSCRQVRKAEIHQVSRATTLYCHTLSLQSQNSILSYARPSEPQLYTVIHRPFELELYCHTQGLQNPNSILSYTRPSEPKLYTVIQRAFRPRGPILFLSFSACACVVIIAYSHALVHCVGCFPPYFGIIWRPFRRPQGVVLAWSLSMCSAVDNVRLSEQYTPLSGFDFLGCDGRRKWACVK